MNHRRIHILDTSHLLPDKREAIRKLFEERTTGEGKEDSSIEVSLRGDASKAKRFPKGTLCLDALKGKSGYAPMLTAT